MGQHIQSNFTIFQTWTRPKAELHKILGQSIYVADCMRLYKAGMGVFFVIVVLMSWSAIIVKFMAYHNLPQGKISQASGIASLARWEKIEHNNEDKLN